ncbi:MAG TPA: hypothetical protein VJU86_06180 [Pyrinomonadaceae bacterium]|nr:hypothetical protein [Pyrinomonadaceae bacterium]
MWNVQVAFLLTLVLAPLPLAHAQHTLATPHLIERVVKDKEPSCKLAHVSISKNQKENYAYLIWKCDEQEVRVDVNEYDSAEDARITPKSLLTANFRSPTRLSGIGDEAFLLGEGSYSKGRFNVVFRKGKVRMDVTASSADMAQRFARYFAEALPAAEQTIRRDAK